MKTINTYISLVRAALWGTKAEWPVEQTEMLLRLNACQGTGSLVYPAVLDQADLPAPARMQMKTVCMQTMQQHVQLQHTLQTAWQALEQAGVRPVLMKGAGLAALYPQPFYRTWGDIDLFVGKEQYHPGCEVMRATFPKALKFDEELDHYKHYNLIADGVSIEVHRVSATLQHPVDERRYAHIEAQGMSHAEPLTIGDVPVRVPEQTFNTLFVFLHSWEHMMTQGATVRQLCDLALLLHCCKDRIDRKQLKRDLRALHLFDVWQVFMSMVVNGLLLPSEEAPFYNPSEAVADRSKRLFYDLLNGKLVAPKSTEQAPTNRILRKIHTMNERLRNALRIKTYSPAYARHMMAETYLHGALRLFAKDRHWE